MTSQHNGEIRTYFGQSPQPYQEGYYTKAMNLRIVDDELLSDCTRCRKTVKIPIYKIHPDGAITFSFYCGNCQQSFHVYRNSYEDFEKVKRALRK